MKRISIVLLLSLAAACPHHPTTWEMELKGAPGEPEGWREVMDAARGLASCDLRGKWGGTITVMPEGPYQSPTCGLVWGSNPGDHSIDVSWTARARNGALPEEACHAWLSICEKNFRAEPARACAATIKAMLL